MCFPSFVLLPPHPPPISPFIIYHLLSPLSFCSLSFGSYPSPNHFCGRLGSLLFLRGNQGSTFFIPYVTYGRFLHHRRALASEVEPRPKASRWLMHVVGGPARRPFSMGWFCPQRIFGNIWRNFCCLNWVGGCFRHVVGRGQDCCQAVGGAQAGTGLQQGTTSL